MKPSENSELLVDLNGALAMIGQAQERTPNGTEVWIALGALYDNVDDMIEGIKEGYHDGTD